jgi:peptidoglycan/LPS O-acetylase OafA/YrhL
MTGSTVVPQGWSLDVELWFYLLMGLILSRKKEIALVWLEVSFIFTITTVILGLDFAFRKNTVFAGSLPFAIGANIWYFKEQIRPIPLWGFLTLLGLFIANILSYHFLGVDRTMEGFYASMLISSFVLISLVNLDKSSLGRGFLLFDKLLGDLSYPMYVSHFLIGGAVLLIFWGEPKYRGWDFFITAYAYIIVFSYVLNRYIEHPIESLRSKIKRVQVYRN